MNLIIDNDSGMNVMSWELADKLRLKVEKHPNPYKICWVNDTMIMVRPRCLVSFSLGKNYKDTIWCDIIPMKVCIFYWEDWLYSKREHHDGYSNTYSFMYNE
jgi:hypothetical protein